MSERSGEVQRYKSLSNHLRLLIVTGPRWCANFGFGFGSSEVLPISRPLENMRDPFKLRRST